MQLPQGHILEPGMQGVYVRLLQFELQLFEVEISDDEVFGNAFGPDTKQAIVRLQEDLGLQDVTAGIVARQTADSLNRVVGEQIPAERIVDQLALAIEVYQGRIDDLQETGPNPQTVRGLQDALQALGIVHEELQGQALAEAQARVQELEAQLNGGQDDTEQCIVRGEVRQANGRPLDSALVQAIEKGLRGRDQPLGETQSDERGRYEITYSRQAGKKCTALIVRVLSANNELSVESELIHKPEREQVVDLMVGGGDIRAHRNLSDCRRL